MDENGRWEFLFEGEIKKSNPEFDPAHDLLHLQRVVKTAKFLCQKEGGKMEVVVPAAWLHDFVVIPKDDLRRSEASRISARMAKEFLENIGYPRTNLDAIGHAIESHSYSAGITPLTIEAKIVQDADRLDGLGAIGIARCFVTAGLTKRALYKTEDPFCEKRNARDSDFTLDHFYQKLFRVAETLQTNHGQQEGLRRLGYMKDYLKMLASELE